MERTENIKSLIERLADAELLYKKGFGNAMPSKPDTLLYGLSDIEEIETMLLYEITSKGFFDLNTFKEKHSEGIIESVKILQKLDLYKDNYKELLYVIRQYPSARNVRLQILERRCRNEEICNGEKTEKIYYSSQYLRDKKEINFLKPMVFRAILRTMKKVSHDKTTLIVYDIEKDNVVIEKTASNYNFTAKWTVSHEVIKALKEIPINHARIWCYRWNRPIKNYTPGTHNDSFVFSSNNCKIVGRDENAQTVDLCFENGVAINGCPIEESNYAYNLVKQAFSIIQIGGVDLYELDRKGELY